MSPLYAGRVAQELKGKIEEFQENEKDNESKLRKLLGVLGEFQALGRAEVLERLAALEGSRFGALPTDEQDTKPFIIPFEPGRQWQHHRHAREWAAGVLAGVTTFAADGSTISPYNDLSVPVGMIQIGWFQNPHDATRPYMKDVYIEVMSPREVRKAHAIDSVDTEIEWRRYKGETEQAIAFMEAHSGTPALVFMDGTHTVSFVNTMPDFRQRQFRDCVQELMAVSERTGIPAVGYVADSRAIDLAYLLACLHEGYKVTPTQYRQDFTLSDAALLRAYAPRLEWGDRCRTFVCDRDDGVAGNQYYERICFTYLQTTRAMPPARLEIPRWVFENEELYAWTLDVVRAECVVGVGYPYPLETADSVAVLTGEDRERFYRLFQEFAAQNALNVRFSRKSISKRGRRV